MQCLIENRHLITSLPPAAPAAGATANGIAQILFTSEDKLTESRTAQAKAIFEGLRRGTIDRTLFT